MEEDTLSGGYISDDGDDELVNDQYRKPVTGNIEISNEPHHAPPQFTRAEYQPPPQPQYNQHPPQPQSQYSSQPPPQQQQSQYNQPPPRHVPHVDDIDEDVVSNKSASYGIPSTVDVKKRKTMALMKIKQIERKYKITATRPMSMNNSLLELEEEADLLSNLVGRENKVMLVKNFTPYGVGFLEYLNTKYDPFSLKLEGWMNETRERLEDGDMDDSINRLVEKYESQLELPPELEFAGLICMYGANVNKRNARAAPATSFARPQNSGSVPMPSASQMSRPMAPPAPAHGASGATTGATKLRFGGGGDGGGGGGGGGLGLFGDLAADIDQVKNTVASSKKPKKGLVINM